MILRLKQTVGEPIGHHAIGEPRQPLATAAVYAVIGLAPISALALSLVEVLPLHVGGPVLVGTAASLGIVLQFLSPGSAGMALRGLATGLIAVLVYDCTRLPFVLIGTVNDFIPRIGVWLLKQPDAHWSIGYVWRYFGNGAGMGLTFAMISPLVGGHRRSRSLGIIYGVLIWTGLLSTLLIAPNGQSKMFPLTPVTVALTLTGHLVYGAVLGIANAGVSRPNDITNVRC